MQRQQDFSAILFACEDAHGSERKDSFLKNGVLSDDKRVTFK